MSVNTKPEGQGTIVGTSVKLTGAIKDSNDIMVFGQVDGEVSSESNIFIGETAFVKGPISANQVSISGKIHGSIEAREKIEIEPTGFINGSISTKELIMKSGATFIGKCAMPDKTKGEDEIEVEKSEDLKKEQEKG